MGGKVNFQQEEELTFLRREILPRFALKFRLMLKIKQGKRITLILKQFQLLVCTKV